MTTTMRRRAPGAGAFAARIAAVGYGATAYVLFLLVFSWAIAFVEDIRMSIGDTDLVPRTIDRGGPTVPAEIALLVNVLLLTLFAAQHSVMARAGFKRWWTRIVPATVERSTYVLAASLCLAALMWWWCPMTAELWDVSGTRLSSVLVAVSLAGWLLVLASTILIDHFDLFGLRQVIADARGRPAPTYRFVTPLWYGIVRHPIYLGFLIAFWVAPTMTVGHLVFAIATTGFVLLGIQLEERDLVRAFGADYLAYRKRVPMLLPGLRHRA
ncbi:methanethiol S-methyltransferase [Gordonia sp. SL306]|uniref:methanethiol S-methyltransferase n=1 Tax=Gordonia sp. SL306 TaxID=2995145 RepID=UPI002271FA23|nr:methanethiol S-methyltransferase [Gordonia sp. SL306]WAC55767.1 isoprenylcysteine carboxylmethyltransferase family protein [Gordonia sp. SL306]